MSRRSSAEDGGGEAVEMVRLSVRKDLFPEPTDSPPEASPTGVKLETDFEASIDSIALEKVQNVKKRNHKVENNVRSKSSKKKNKKRRSTPPDSEDDSDEEDNRSLASTIVPLLSNCTVRLSRGGGKPYSQKLEEMSKPSWGAAPPSGKPWSMMRRSSSKKKSKKSSASPSNASAPASETYQSQIIGSTNNLRIKIKKSTVTKEPPPGPNVKIPERTATPTSSTNSKRVRANKSSSKKRKVAEDPQSASSGEEYEPGSSEVVASAPASAKQNHKAKGGNSKVKEKKSHAKSKASKEIEIGPQGPWGAGVPIPVLTQIFQHVISDGTLPSVVRLGRVCRLWQTASVQCPLWKTVELSPRTKDKFKTDYILYWLLQHRLTHTESLNLAHWGVDNIANVVKSLVELVPNLKEVNLAGWDRLTPELLLDLVTGLKQLSRLDLSHMSESGSCLTACSLGKMTAAIGPRLTHLIISNNHFSALNQILNSIATNCPNLEVLDFSGAKATSHPASVPLEALQRGCTRLRVLRAANAQLVIPCSSNHPEGPGFPQLEELSAATEWSGKASLTVGDYRLEDEGLARILKCATRLKLLDLRGCRVSGSGLVRVPAWDLQHLFLAGCNITRQRSSCLELICEKWAHSLLEVDFSWASATEPLHAAIEALADKADGSQLRIVNLCGSSVAFEPLKKLLLKCPRLESVNLSSCRALPRGMKRLYSGKELRQLIDSLDPNKKKPDEEEEGGEKGKKGKKKSVEQKESEEQINEESIKIDDQVPEEKRDEDSKLNESPSSETTAGTPKSENSQSTTNASPDSVLDSAKEGSWTLNNFRNSLPIPVSSSSPKVATPITQTETSNSNWALGNYSPMARIDQPIQSPYSTQASPLARPEVQQKSPYGSQQSPYASQQSPYASQQSPAAQSSQQPKSPYSPLARTDATPQPQAPYSSHASPLSRPEAPQKSPYTNQPSPLARPDMSQPLSPYTTHPSPRPRPDNQTPQQLSPYPTHTSPYSTQPSPYSSQRSPYSSQRSPYSSQHSPFSTQQSPYSAQQSPDTSQVPKLDVQKSWNMGNYSPAAAVKPYLNYPVQASPDSGPGAHYSPATNLNDHVSPRHISQYANCQGMTNLSPNVRNDFVNMRNDSLVKNIVGLPDGLLDGMSPDTSNSMLRFAEPRLKDNRQSVYPESSSVE